MFRNENTEPVLRALFLGPAILAWITQSDWLRILSLKASEDEGQGMWVGRHVPRTNIRFIHPVTYHLAQPLAHISMIRKVTRFCPDRRSPRIRHVGIKRMHNVINSKRGRFFYEDRDRLTWLLIFNKIWET